MKRTNELICKRMIRPQSALSWPVILAVALSSGPVAHSQTLTTLYSFEGIPSDGSGPCGVVSRPDGSFTGTTLFGGLSGYGTVFLLDSSGVEDVVHSFSGSDDGLQPCAPLTRGSDGAWYGTTEYGGNGYNGFGTVFRIQGRTFSTIHTFTGPDGAFPYSPLTLNIDGLLYGTTAQGGVGSCPGGCGTAFRMDTLGNVTVLHSFNGSDGAGPEADLIHDARGNLYGITNGGGVYSGDCPNGCGTAFRIDTTGKLEVLHRFTGGTGDGWYLLSGLVHDEEGNLYGATAGGGTYGAGTVFEITRDGEEKLLYSFKGTPDGYNPESLVRDKSGNLFGTTILGGSLDCTNAVLGCGIIFELDSTGVETVLYEFNGTFDGAQPSGPIFLDSQGNLYGTTMQGVKGGCSAFSLGCGTVWKLEMGSPE